MSLEELRERIKSEGLYNADYTGEEDPVCPSFKTPFGEHIGLFCNCRDLQEVIAELHSVYRKWESDKYLLRGALRIIRDAKLNAGSTELLEAAKKEDLE